jgi:calcium-dependent protein kinase
LQVIGSGTYGSVIKGKKKNTKIVRAIKIIPKNKVKNPERFKREIEIMMALVKFLIFMPMQLGSPKHHKAL